MNQRLSQLILSARDNAERGAVMFLVAITALIVMVAGAIAVDLSAVSTRGQSLQNAADSAALAGVQAYRQSMGDRTEATPADEAAAVAAVNALLEQNGITDISPGIEFPDEENDTEVRVTLFDDDAGFLLSGFTGGGAGTVERSATARFERCESSCIREVAIPPPFNGVDTSGDGDGYKPIPVGNALYSINHQSGASQGTLQITCVLRGLRHRADRPPSDNVEDKTQLCWDDLAGAPVPGKTAYPSNYVSSIRSTPEMPHAAVVDTRIYWATSTSGAHYLFCFETTTATPCSQPMLLSNSGDGLNQGGLRHRESHRGGGTIAVNERIYTFTDDHRVHCVLPTSPMTTCAGYPMDTALGADDFPNNLPAEGNHGSSIDRIATPDGTRIYSTIHVRQGTETMIAECAENPNDIGYNGLVAAEQSGDPVVIRSNTGLFIELNEISSTQFELIDGSDASREEAQWRVHDANSGRGRVFAFESVSSPGKYLVMSQESPPWNKELTVANRTRWSTPYDYVFLVSTTGSDPSTQTSEISTYWTYQRPDGAWEYATLWEGVEDPAVDPPDFVFKGGEPNNSAQGAWKFHAPCGEPTDETTGLLHTTGTYLNCHEPGIGACGGFSPVRLHADGSSFSGRLFFHRDGAGNPTGVCSTGFNTQWSNRSVDFGPNTEVVCVTANGGPADSLETDLLAFKNRLAIANNGAPIVDVDGVSKSWGTWGDPHYNVEQNRLFYPTHRLRSTVICWDFATGYCGEQLKQVSPLNIPAQDYGFFSEGNCVFGLGHTANFYAFKADNPDQECDTSSTSTWITPCNCGGDQYWGSLEFDVTEEQFEEFFIEIRDENNVRVYPPSPLDALEETPPHDLLTEGSTVNLSDYPVFGENPRLRVLVTVKSFPGIDPWADGEGSQTFTVEIGRAPRLTD